MTRVPLTHPVSFFVHEEIVPLIQELADEEYKGNKSDLIRLLVYAELLTKGKLNINRIRELG